VEIDAASNTGVDYVRELREQVAYRPMHARFKIYIVDEVHMLSKPAFNALLKTLEEPPPHVKFLFATTEPEKVLETVVSRCQVLRLVPLSEQTIAERLAAVFAEEGVRAEAGVSEALARRARGGMRDALSLADQLLSLAGDAPLLSDIDRLSAAATGADFEHLFDALEAGERARAISALPPHEGGEAEFLSGLLDHLRATLLVGLCGEDVPLVGLSRDERQHARQRAQRLGTERLELWLEELLIARERMRELPQHARLALEVALLDLCRSDSSLSFSEIAERLEALEARVGGGAGARAAQAQRPAAPPPAAPRELRPTPAPPASPVRDAQTLWNRFLDELAQSSGTLAETLRTRGRLGEFGGRRVSARVTNLGEAERGLFQTPRNQKACAQILTRLLGREVDFVLEDPPAPQRDPQALWKQFLEELEQHSGTLAETLRTRGRLGEFGERRVSARVTNLGESERVLFQTPRNQKACAQILTRLLGREVEFVLEAPLAPARQPKDAFTGRVQELFSGRVEDEG